MQHSVCYERSVSAWFCDLCAVHVDSHALAGTCDVTKVVGTLNHAAYNVQNSEFSNDALSWTAGSSCSGFPSYLSYASV